MYVSEFLKRIASLNLAVVAVVAVAVTVAACSEDTIPIIDDSSSGPGATQSLVARAPGGTRTTGAASLGADSPSEYALGSNDRLRITVFGE